MIYINDANLTLLKQEENMSGLINSLLKQHYIANDINELSLEAKRAKLREINVVDPKKIVLKEKLISEIQKEEGEIEERREELAKREIELMKKKEKKQKEIFNLINKVPEIEKKIYKDMEVEEIKELQRQYVEQGIDMDFVTIKLYSENL